MTSASCDASSQELSRTARGAGNLKLIGFSRPLRLVTVLGRPFDRTTGRVLMKVNVSFGRGAQLAAALAIGTALAVSASAQTVLVDFGSANSFRGVNVPNPDPNGNVWNSLTPGPFFTDLKDTAGNATAIDLG